MNNADAYRLKFWLTPNVLLTNHLKGLEQQAQEEAAVAAKAAANAQNPDATKKGNSTPNGSETTGKKGQQQKGGKGKGKVA